MRLHYNISYKSKKEGKDQESIQSSTIADPGYQFKPNGFVQPYQLNEYFSNFRFVWWCLHFI